MKGLSLVNIVLLCLFFLQVKGQDNYDILNWKAQQTLRTYLLQEMHAQYDLRRVRIAEALESRENMLDYRDECRKNYLTLLEEFPEKTQLNPLITGKINSGKYRIENVLFESRPNHHVTANIYIPSEKGPSPAVIFFCGHEMTSKASESYQRTAALFAKNGFVAMLVDPISQGERVQFTDKDGHRLLRGSTTEHTLLNAGANLVGTNVVSYELYDNVRSLDYLISRPEVDSSRIGCLGNSGGGTQTAYFMAYDERVKVAAPCSYIARRERNFDLYGANDGCQHTAFEGDMQLEISDFMIMFAPKPSLILAGRYDFVDYTGTKETADELQSVYSVLGVPDKFELFTVDDGHGISKPKREAAVRWFRRWLSGDNSNIIEPDIRIQNEKDLNCTPNGQVNSMFPDEQNVQEINMAFAKAMEGSRRQFSANNDLVAYQDKIESLLSITAQAGTIDIELRDTERYSSYKMEKMILRAEGEVPLPCLIYMPVQDMPYNKLVIYVLEDGKAVVAADDSLINANIRQGNVLLLADLRGFGETKEREDANDSKYYNKEYNNAMISLHIKRPLPGQRVRDIFTLLDYKARNVTLAGLPVQLIASKSAGPVAIYAAMFRPEIKSVHIINSIQSYFEILERPMDKDWFSYVVPDVLKYFDLPDLIGLRDDLHVDFENSLVTELRPHWPTDIGFDNYSGLISATYTY